jgi:sec-independent protein translocase protein TatC
MSTGEVPPASATDEIGGERKSFWDHLRDLRTALLRSAIAIGAALIVCLFVVDKIVVLLEYPLQHIDQFEKPRPTVAFKIGSAELGPFPVTAADFPGLPPGDAPHAVYRVGVVKIGDQQVLALQPSDEPGTAASALQVRLHNLSPGESFFLAFRISLYAAIIVSAPFWIYFLGQFFLPALSIRERKVLYQWMAWGLLLFFIGVCLTYFVLLPIALRVSVQYSQLLGFDANDWRADAYIGFVTKFIIGMGLGFQFPIVVLLLVKIGLLTHQQLAHYRRHVVVITLILGALLTTPEVVTQVAMAVPLYLLYEISIWIAWYWDWKKRRADVAAG